MGPAGGNGGSVSGRKRLHSTGRSTIERSPSTPRHSKDSGADEPAAWPPSRCEPVACSVIWRRHREGGRTSDIPRAVPSSTAAHSTCTEVSATRVRWAHRRVTSQNRASGARTIRVSPRRSPRVARNVGRSAVMQSCEHLQWGGGSAASIEVPSRRPARQTERSRLEARWHDARLAGGRLACHENSARARAHRLEGIARMRGTLFGVRPGEGRRAHVAGRPRCVDQAAKGC